MQNLGRSPTHSIWDDGSKVNGEDRMRDEEKGNYSDKIRFFARQAGTTIEFEV